MALRSRPAGIGDGEAGPCVLHVDSILFRAVEHFIHPHWSPEQIALARTRLYPKGHDYRVSHKTIYNGIYA